MDERIGFGLYREGSTQFAQQFVTSSLTLKLGDKFRHTQT